jgi:hypothetical protein
MLVVNEEGIMLHLDLDRGLSELEHYAASQGQVGEGSPTGCFVRFEDGPVEPGRDGAIDGRNDGVVEMCGHA